MSRLAEWTLGIAGVALVILSAGAVWNSLGDVQSWSFPAPVLLVWLILAIVALAGIVMDVDARSHGWGLLTWIATGALLGSAVIGFLEFGLFLVPAIIALLGAALLGDRRRNRRARRHLGLAMATAAVVFSVELLLILSPN